MSGHGQCTSEIIRRSDTAEGLAVLLRGRVVERTFAWLGGCRRLARDWERSIESATAWATIAHLRILTRRLARCDCHDIVMAEQLFSQALRLPDPFPVASCRNLSVKTPFPVTSVLLFGLTLPVSTVRDVDRRSAVRTLLYSHFLSPFLFSAQKLIPCAGIGPGFDKRPDGLGMPRLQSQRASFRRQ